MKLMKRASVAAAKRFIKAKGWHLDGKEVVIPAASEDGPELRVSVTKFCGEYAEKIEAFDADRLRRRKRFVKAQQARADVR